MNSRYELEVLLRPAVEVYSVVVCVCAAVLLLLAPGLVLMPPPVARGCAAVLLFWAVLDSWKVYRIWHYRAGMKGQPGYRVPSKAIPTKRDGLFIGRGFEWEQHHTQRLVDTHDTRYSSFAKEYGVADWALSYWRGRPRESGGNPFLHGVEPKEKDLFLPLSARANHTIVFGVPGVGKTRQLELFVTQDIHRKPHEPVIVVDPKGDAELLRRMYIEAKAAGREQELIVFSLGHPEASARYNAVGQFSRITEVATRLSNPLPREGNAAAFAEFAWRFTNVIAKALYTFGERVDYNQVRDHIVDVEPLFIKVVDKAIAESDVEHWTAVLDQLDSQLGKGVIPRPFTERSREGYLRYQLVAKHGGDLGSDVARDLAAAFKYDRTYYDKLVSSISPLLEKLTTGMVGELLAPDYFDTQDPRPTFDWTNALRRGAIVYIGLDALSDTTVSSAVGNSMLSDLVSVAGRIYKHGLDSGTPASDAPKRVWLHFDEINELAGEEFIPMVNKCRGAGMYVTAYTQAVQDIEARLGSGPKAEQLLGNFGNKLFMRVGNNDSAKLLTESLPNVRISTIMAVSGVTDSNDMVGESHFSSRNEDRISTETVPLIDESAVAQLPIGQAFATTDGGRLLKTRIPLIADKAGDESIPERISDLVDALSQNRDPGHNWARQEQWWHEDVSHA